MKRIIKLSQRLKKIAGFVEDDARLTDIGSDHGYLPIWLVKNEIISYAVAGEVILGPYQGLNEAVQAHDVEANIKTRLGSGVEVLEEEDNIDTVVVAGMGGLLIIDILKEGLEQNKLKNINHLILQPNKDVPALRRWLINHQFYIEDEALVEDKGKFYEIISAKKGTHEKAAKMTEADFIFSLFLKEKYPELFHKKWQEEYTKKRKIKEEILKHSKHHDIRQLEKELENIKEALT